MHHITQLIYWAVIFQWRLILFKFSITCIPFPPIMIPQILQLEFGIISIPFMSAIHHNICHTF